jgi:hypothetical protein
VTVAVTASVFDHQRQHYLYLGFGAFLDKPLRTKEVFAQLAEHLGVEFIFADEITAPAEVEMYWANISLPADLYNDLEIAIR